MQRALSERGVDHHRTPAPLLQVCLGSPAVHPPRTLRQPAPKSHLPEVGSRQGTSGCLGRQAAVRCQVCMRLVCMSATPWPPTVQSCTPVVWPAGSHCKGGVQWSHPSFQQRHKAVRKHKQVTCPGIVFAVSRSRSPAPECSITAKWMCCKYRFWVPEDVAYQFEAEWHRREADMSRFTGFVSLTVQKQKDRPEYTCTSRYECSARWANSCMQHLHLPMWGLFVQVDERSGLGTLELLTRIAAKPLAT